MINGYDLPTLVQTIKEEALPTSKRDFVSDIRKLAFTSEKEHSTISFALNGSAEMFQVNRLCGQQIASKIGIPSKYWDKMRTEAPELLDRNVNHWFQNKSDVRMLRTLKGQARAFLSERYRPLDNIDIAAHVLPRVIDSGFQVKSSEITEQRMYIQLVTPKIQGEVKKDDIVQSGLIISNSEVGCGSLKIEPLVYRLVCLNGMIAGQSLYKKHIGKSQVDGMTDGSLELLSNNTKGLMDKAFWAQVNDIVDQVTSQATFDKLLIQMQEATQIKLNVPTEAVEIVSKRFDLQDFEQESILNNLITGGDSTKWGLVNAITATANDMEDYDRGVQFERFGGEVLELPASDVIFSK
ncbi:MAG: DUF932 domain-containing protein [Candidatus Pacebacteria bacterium]|nr:DUF932 domain-containing protein [Candidatus Paceibacterota bacterium]